MPPLKTELRNDLARGLDARPASEVLSTLLSAQVAAARSVEAAIPQIAKAARATADTIARGGRIGYAAAGSSGLMALADGLELPGTYSIPIDRIAILLAGGLAGLSDMTGAPEDDTGEAERAVREAGLAAGDCLICLSASGTTPYALRALRAVREDNVTTVAIACNAGTPLLMEADIPIFLDTPPEIVAGSTRMGAGTAQKITLNMISTLMAVHLGHVHDGFMVSLQADNIKLAARASAIVASIGGCDPEDARRYLDQANGSVKIAVLLAAGAESAEAARQSLEDSNQRLRTALSGIAGGTGS
ncbi:MAG: N-acetylmuramic acid 6-phosphate etherase [Alphaproteobacteria bacterium]